MNRDELIDFLGERMRRFRAGDTGQITETAVLMELMALAGMTMGSYDKSGELDMAAFIVVVEVFQARARDAEWSLLTSVARHVAPALPADFLAALGISTELESGLTTRYDNALALLHRAALGERIPLDGVITELRQIVQQLPRDLPILPGALANLGAAHRMRYEATGNPIDLGRALAAGEASVRLGANRTDLSGHALHQFNYGQTAWLVYQRTKDIAHAETAATAYRAAQMLFPPDHVNRRWIEGNFVPTLTRRFETTGDLRLLDKLVEIAEASAGSAALNNLAMIRQNVYLRTGDPGQLDAARAYLERALDSIPAEHETRAAILTNLNLNLRLRFELTGDRRLLEDAIAAGREAVAAGLDGHPTPAMYANALHALSIALRVRFETTGLLASADEAIDLARQATAVVQPEPEGASYLTALGNALVVRYDRTENPDDLAEAVRVRRAALAAFPVDSQNHAMTAANLASALGRVGTPEARDEAIDISRRALSRLPVGHPHLRLCASTLSGELLNRYVERHQHDDLREAITVGRSSLGVLDGHGQDAQMYLNLGTALIAAFRRDGDPATAAEAMAVLRTGALLTAAAPSIQLDCAGQWARLAAEAQDWATATEAYQVAVELFVRRAARHLSRPDAEHHLNSDKGLIWDAVACAVRAGDPALAVRLLEQGRGILLNQALDLRGDISALESREPALAARFRALCLAFEQLHGESGRHLDGDRRAALAREWDATLAEIRSRPRLAGFLGSPDEADLRAVATAGPIVIVNVSRYGADAIIVSAEGVRAIPLPGVDLKSVLDGVRVFLMATMSLTGIPGAPARAAIMGLFAWLWDDIARPVLRAIGSARRVWWSPAGLLTLLPLHMAGHHDGTRDTVLDRVVCSYAPTLRVLRQAQTRPVPPGRPGSGAVIALPVTPGLPDLPGAAAEARVVSARFPDATTVSGPAATRARVLDELAAAPWAHFACHATSNPVDPSSAGIFVHDGLLGVTEISRLRLTTAEFAYLGACETARGGLALADEAIHIASALQVAGYRHVVAAQWRLADDIAVDAAAAIYDRIDMADLTGLADRTHQAVHALRAKYPDRPEHWGALVHIGP